MNQHDLLLNRMLDLADKAVKTGYAASRFLTPAEAQSVAAYFKYRQVGISFDGGFESAERTRAVFFNPDWGECDHTELFTALRIEHRPQDAPGHRDILGAIMALGIERDTVGDIVCADGYATLVCLPEMGDYIVKNLSKAGRVGINVTEISLYELPVTQEELKEKTDTVASLRLDAVMCAAFGLSRTKASELIASGRVSLDHQQCLQPSKDLREGALLSIRGMGRARLLEVGGTSRKGRIFVRLGVFGN